MDIESIHHVTLTISDLGRSKQFYREILMMEEMGRPNLPLPGAWFQAGSSQQLHLIVHPDGTFRGEKEIDTHDVHFGVRVKSYRRAIEFSPVQGFQRGGARRRAFRRSIF